MRGGGVGAGGHGEWGEWARAGTANGAAARHPVRCQGCPCAAIARPPRSDVCTTLLLQIVCNRLSPKEVG